MCSKTDADGFLPCPFCGGTEIHMETWSRQRGEWLGKVTNECCGYTFIVLNVVGSTKKEMIEFYKRRWNKRPEKAC